MKIYEYSNLDKKQIVDLCTRTQALDNEKLDIVKNIQADILENGNSAILKYAKKYDNLQSDSLKISQSLIDESEKFIDESLKKSIGVAIENITKFHKSQLDYINSDRKNHTNTIETTKGINCWQRFVAINNVGLYIPAGNSPLFSTVLMLAIPAIIAGCKNISICSPANHKGQVDNHILYCAKILGIKNVYQIGGSQAIFALAYGSDEIEPVNKIFGPGNSFVTIAKMLVSNKVAIDMPAGPSEVLIIADDKSNPVFLASDVLSQLEHGGDSQAVLVCDDQDIISQTLNEISKQQANLPAKELITSSLGNSYAVKVKNMDQAYEFSNAYAPEHLIIHNRDYENYLEKIENAGSVFCGSYTPESLGDYASGTNHTLPTSGFATSYSGLNTLSFGKIISYQKASKQGLTNIGNHVENMAGAEELFAHKNAVTVRLHDLGK